MTAPPKRSAPPSRGQTGQIFSSHGSDAIEETEVQAVIREGMYQRRLEWLHDGLADLELSAVSCLLRAPRGGEARSILSRLPDRLTLDPLDEIVSAIRRKLLPWTRWESELQPLFADAYAEQIRSYSSGRKATFTTSEAAAHKALSDLLRRGGALA